MHYFAGETFFGNSLITIDEAHFQKHDTLQAHAHLFLSVMFAIFFDNAAFRCFDIYVYIRIPEAS